VLTATDSTQYAWEGESIIGDVENSLFTHYLIEGLRTGSADIDQDGQITIDELYDYIYEHVLNETPKQTPGKWTFGQQGDIIIAQNPALIVPRLPIEIEEALKSNLPSVRFQALNELKAVLQGRHEGRANAARAALDLLATDDSRKVAAGAQVLKDAFDSDETLSEEEWLRRVAQHERESSGPKDVASQIESYVAAATACLGKGDVAGARELLGRAARLDAAHPDVVSLQQRVTARASEAQQTLIEQPSVKDRRAAGTAQRASLLSPALSAIRWLRASTFSTTAMRVVAGLVLAVGVGIIVLNMPMSSPNDLAAPASTPSTAPTTTSRPPEATPTPPTSSSSGSASSGSAKPPETATPEQATPPVGPITTGKKPGEGRSGRGRIGALPGSGPSVNTKTSDHRTPEGSSGETRKAGEDRGTATAATPTAAPSATANPPANTAPTPPSTAERETRKPEPAPPEPSKPESAKVESNRPPTNPAPPAPDIKAASPPIPNEASLREGIRAYAQAFSSGNRNAVKGVYPEISDRELREFDALRDDFGPDRYGMNISIRNIKIDGTRARVKCVIFHTGIDNTGKTQQIPSNEELNFAWTGSTWIRVR
jgi:hypothetical protein